MYIKFDNNGYKKRYINKIKRLKIRGYIYSVKGSVDIWWKNHKREWIVWRIIYLSILWLRKSIGWWHICFIKYEIS